MYIPEHFRQSDEALLDEFVAANSFGILITGTGVDQIATHLPMLLLDGKLIGHVAKANPQAQHLIEGAEAMAIFHGPHAYVSPSWYGDAEKNVPTWNYTAVHVYGKPAVVSEPELVKAFLGKLTAYYEAGRTEPWTFDPQSTYIEKLLNGIVAFEMVVERMDGKFKLSQNRVMSDRGRVMWALKDSESEMDRQVAVWMERLSFGR